MKKKDKIKKEKPTQIYDKFYKSILSHKLMLKEFIELAFPRLVNYLDLKKAILIKETFIKDDFKQNPLLFQP